MRIRRKPWARPELMNCEFYVDQPALNRGAWSGQFPERRPLHVELGCGKGRFIAELAADHPGINYLAIDIKSEMLAMCKRNIERVFREQGKAPGNIRIFSQDIERLDQVLSPDDEAERIYINFCNPWPKRSYHKHRLTHPRQLTVYKTFLRPGGEIWFKTDDDELFEDSRVYFAEAGFSVRYLTVDLARSGFEGNIRTEHEQMFEEKGISTKFLIACREQAREPVKEPVSGDSRPAQEGRLL